MPNHKAHPTKESEAAAGVSARKTVKTLTTPEIGMKRKESVAPSLSERRANSITKSHSAIEKMQIRMLNADILPPRCSLEV